MTPLIIFHSGCPDGWASAYWLGKHIGEHDKHEGRYGEPPPDCTGRDVYIVDFAYPTEDLDRIAAECRTLRILDHHQTSLGWLKESKVTLFRKVHHMNHLGCDRAMAVLDIDHSGVGLVAEYVQGRYRETAPSWFANIEDRDLWRFALPDTPDVFAAVTSRPYTVEAWDEMDLLGRGGLVAEGRSINRYRDRLIASTVETAFRANILGHEVWCAAAPYAIGSDVAGELAKREPHLFAAYFVQYGEHRRFGLRSAPDGMDVAALAETVGGGGHRHAAGFEQSWGSDR